MEPMTLRAILEATGGTQMGTSVPLDTIVTSVETDSRAVQPGGLFVALKGEKTDGHKYISGAVSKGAAGCLIQEELSEYPAGAFYIKVPDTMTAIGQVASAYKKQFSVPVIGITGSVGKTTTKDMIASVLGQKYRVLKTEGNFNNELGLPLTLFRLTSEHEICVLEMGMNHFGEIDYLTKIVVPDVAVITNIGDAHIENLGSRDGILKAKSEIFNYMKGDSIAVLNGDDVLLRTLEGRIAPRTIFCGKTQELPYRAKEVKQIGSQGVSCTLVTPKGEFSVSIPALGNHMIYPALMACAIGEAYGLTPKEVKQGIETFVPTKMRMNILHAGSVTILDDGYNANPQSMRAALEVLSQSGGARRVAILGDMFELGDLAPEMHRGIGEFAGSLGNIDTLLAIGENAWHIYDAACGSNMKDVIYAKDKREALAFLPPLVKPETVILVKASRGMAFEEITKELQKLAKER